MTDNDNDNDNGNANQQTYRVVVNHEEQYSIWPTERELPNGWRDEGTTGTKEEVLGHIDQVWTDMRPLSLRKHMAEIDRRLAESGGDRADDTDSTDDTADDDEESLVARLSQGSHPVEISLLPERTGPALRDAIGRGYVFVRFTGTRGATELGIQLDREDSDLAEADFATPAGRIRLVGDLTLDFEPVRCTTEIDLATMSGQGHLVARERAE